MSINNYAGMRLNPDEHGNNVAVIVNCDAHGCFAGRMVYFPAPTDFAEAEAGLIAQARQRTRAGGWVGDGEKDYCPRHTRWADGLGLVASTPPDVQGTKTAEAGSTLITADDTACAASPGLGVVASTSPDLGGPKAEQTRCSPVDDAACATTPDQIGEPA